MIDKALILECQLRQVRADIASLQANAELVRREFPYAARISYGLKHEWAILDDALPFNPLSFSLDDILGIYCVVRADTNYQWSWRCSDGSQGEGTFDQWYKAALAFEAIIHEKV